MTDDRFITDEACRPAGDELTFPGVYNSVPASGVHTIDDHLTTATSIPR